MSRMPSPSQMYRAVVQRDAAFLGVFVFGVRTTGVFCLPTCRSRRPRAEHVEYFATPHEALQAGYRPCRRCRPLAAGAAPPEWVERAMAEVERRPDRRVRGADLRAMSIAPSRARRYFKAHYGMTFGAYCRARRLGLALGAMRQGANMTRAGMEHGYSSDSGFREAFEKLFGAPPGRSVGRTCLVARWLETPLGPMLAAAHEDGLCLLEFLDRRAMETQVAVMRRRLGAAVVPGDNAVLHRIDAELREYFAGRRTEFTVPLVKSGTAFQLAVWERLLRIPYGQTLSYAALARDIGRADAQRAVGRANGDNRLAIVIPCHRVVRSDGTLCGYGGGMWRKQRLLDLERAVLERGTKAAPDRLFPDAALPAARRPSTRSQRALPAMTRAR